MVVFNRDANGGLTLNGNFQTQGNGVGAGGLFGIAGTSNPLVLDANHQHLYAVNPGSDTISVFTVDNDNSLTLIGTPQSSVGSLGSTGPISLAIHGDLLYVLNAGIPPDANATPPTAGTPGSITGFTITNDGTLTPLADSTEPLTANATNTSQIQFTPDGNTLVVTDKASQTIITYAVEGNGIAGQPVATTSQGTTPFGFAFTSNGILVVSDANVVPGSGPTPDGGTVSSYSLNGTTVTPITSTLAANGTATCWVEITANDQYAYSTNTANGTIVADQIDADGNLTLLDNGNQGLTTVTTEANPEVLDLAVVGNDYLYAADATSGQIFAYAIADNGDLNAISDGNATGLPDSFVGVAAY